MRVPGAALARAIASRILCAVALADSCGDEPALIAAYGTEVGELVRDHMPTLAFEDGRARFRSTGAAAAARPAETVGEEGAVRRTDAGLPVTAFVHVVDRRPRASSTSNTGSTTPIPPPSAASRSPRRRLSQGRWETVQVRIGEDGDVDQRASSHHGYNYRGDEANLASDAGFGPLRELNETLGARAENGWGPETHFLLVSGGSHAGNLGDEPRRPLHPRRGGPPRPARADRRRATRPPSRSPRPGSSRSGATRRPKGRADQPSL